MTPFLITSYKVWGPVKAAREKCEDWYCRMTSKEYEESSMAEYREKKRPYDEMARKVLAEWKGQFDAMCEMKPSHLPFRDSDEE